jgi:cell division protein FtsW (lipid II flippase)
MKSKRGFLDQVRNQIRNNEAKDLVELELNHHLENDKKKFLNNGLSEIEAEKKVVSQMGNPVMLGKQFNKIHRPRVDWWMVGLVIMAVGLSLLPILLWDASAGYSRGMKLLQGILALGIIFIIMFLDYRKLLKWKWLFYVAGLIILLLLILMNTSYMNGSPSIRVGLFTIEGTKVIPFFFLATAAFFSRHKLSIWRAATFFAPPLVLVMNLPDSYTFFLLSLMGFVMIWFNQVNKKLLLKLTAIGGTSILLGIVLAWNKVLHPYQKMRFLSFINPEEYANSGGFLYLHMKKLIQTVGWFGQNGSEVFIPSGQTDFVFVSLIYHFGWLLGIGITGVLGLLLIRMIIVSVKIKDEFGQMLIIGGITLFTLQFIYNVSMSLGFLPFIGVSLPFISYGLTPTLLNSIIIGLVLSVYRRKDLIVISSP